MINSSSACTICDHFKNSKSAKHTERMDKIKGTHHMLLSKDITLQYLCEVYEISFLRCQRNADLTLVIFRPFVAVQDVCYFEQPWIYNNLKNVTINYSALSNHFWNHSQRFSSDVRVTHLSSPSDPGASPECQLLKQVTQGPWGLPVDPILRKATDTTAVQLSEMVSLPVLIKHSVTTPLITQ